MNSKLMLRVSKETKSLKEHVERSRWQHKGRKKDAQHMERIDSQGNTYTFRGVAKYDKAAKKEQKPDRWKQREDVRQARRMHYKDYRGGGEPGGACKDKDLSDHLPGSVIVHYDATLRQNCSRYGSTFCNPVGKLTRQSTAAALKAISETRVHSPHSKLQNFPGER